jgi:flagellar basal body-associated protein FliL
LTAQLTLGILYLMEEVQKPQPQTEPVQQAPIAKSTKQKTNFFKQKKILIALVIVLFIGIAAGIFAFVSNSTASLAEEETAVDTGVVETLTPDELGLSITAKPDGKAVKFKISNANDIKSIEYQLTYEADSTAQEKAEGGEDRVQRGITGEADLPGGKSAYESEWLDLGSCSRNVCKYDTGVETLELTLKIVKKDGKVFESQKSHQL